MNELLANAKAIIVSQIISDNTIQRVSEEMLKDYINDYKVSIEGRRLLVDSEKEELLRELKSYFISDLNYGRDLVELERGTIIADPDPEKHEQWTPDTESRFYWRKHKNFLRSFFGEKHGTERASEIINSIDFETEAILENLENPSRDEFNSKGLVVGFIQSGKTANFTALISKAADAGYRFIIVLAGIHDELRQQTQIRIDRELTGHNNLELEGPFVEWNNLEAPRRWENLTSAGWLDANETGEFSGRGINRFNDVFANTQHPVLAIIKKNVKIMDKLIRWVNAASPTVRANVPLLVIDDEADQASVDGNATKKDSDPTRTNEKIRIILRAFPRKAYVGYTATPFANVFIKYDADDETLGDDLYPRNFIYSLPEPPGYFGTKQIFNENLDHYFVTEIENPRQEKQELSNHGHITTGLEEAIYTFFIGIALRNLRGQNGHPMSMMINVDHRINRLNRIGKMIDFYVRTTLPTHYNEGRLQEIYNDFITNAQKLNEKLYSENIYFETEQVLQETVRIIVSKEVIVRTLNSSMADKLDYAKEPSMKVIAIGGNKLSRGLTLEGLQVTYFLRESGQFDTLLQMGRWFGYRKGYEDLVRIYTSKLLWKEFKELAIVELEFRESVSEMVEDPEGRTPADFAIGVRQILGLLPTAKNKLGAAVLMENYGGRQVSVTRLTLEHPASIDHNFEILKGCVSGIIGANIEFTPQGNGNYPSLLATNVPVTLVLPFINSFRVALNRDGTYMEFDKSQLLDFISSKNVENELLMWNVALVSIGERRNNRLVEVIQGISVRTVNRARLIGEPVNGAYNIKAITSKTDRKIDLDANAKHEYDGRTVPLLLLYIIDRSSEPLDKESTTRVPLYQGLSEDDKRDPVSFSIIFPPDDQGRGYYRQII